MRTSTLLTLALLLNLLVFGCGGDSNKSGSVGEHVHVAPHGGQLVEVGEHGSGYNLELVLHPDGFLQIYVLDAHAENFVRISTPSIEIELSGEDNASRTLLCEPVADPATGETVGNTSLFTSTERITDLLPLQGVIPQFQLMEFVYENIAFEFSGNSGHANHEH